MTPSPPTTTDRPPRRDRPDQPRRRSPPPATRRLAPGGTDLVEEDLLVEDVSIDGMCGVY